MLLRVGSAAAELVLTESLLDGDTVLRFRVLTALNKLRASGSSRPLDIKLVETVLAAEVVGHLRSSQILGTLEYAADASEPVAQGLRESMTQEVERIFRLVKLLSPAYDIESAYVGLQSAKRDIHDNALEFLENILKPQLRTLLLPLLDSDFTATQRAELQFQNVFEELQRVVVDVALPPFQALDTRFRCREDGRRAASPAGRCVRLPVHHRLTEALCDRLARVHRVVERGRESGTSEERPLFRRKHRLGQLRRRAAR